MRIATTTTERQLNGCPTNGEVDPSDQGHSHEVCMSNIRESTIPRYRTTTAFPAMGRLNAWTP